MRAVRPQRCTKASGSWGASNCRGAKQLYVVDSHEMMQSKAPLTLRLCCCAQHMLAEVCHDSGCGIVG
jgi:hypothetical protein